MEVVISGRHIDITPPIREYAEQKIAKLPRYFDRITAIEVIADSGGHPPNDNEVEIIVKAERTEPFVSKARGHDLYHCIDETINKLERQLTDHKEKHRNRKHTVGAKAH